MPNLVVENPESLACAASSPIVAVARTAFYLSSRQEPLLAWLHTATTGKNVDHGVVICPPIGYEQVHSHRTLRRLADAVAAQGIPTLRFDWHGTGDSAGSDADPSRVETWHANVRDVIDWMRTGLGCRNVSIVGLRMGAMLAAEALGDKVCENLVLWAPIVSGKAYLRQMLAIDQMAEVRPRFRGAAEGDIEAAGFLIAEQTAAELSKANLLQSPIQCGRALLVGPFDKRLSEYLTQSGIPFDCTSPPGYAEMMLEPHLSRVPVQAIAEITNWLTERILTPTANPLKIDLQTIGPAETLIAGSSPAPSTWGVVRERLVDNIGGFDLFGVLSESSKTLIERPTMVLLNAGSTHHVGPGRLYVELARHLADQGFACLRIDIRGIGESNNDSGDQESNPYPSTMLRDVEVILEELKARFGMKRFVLIGLCSGAYAAFQSAAQLADRGLVESILINPLTYYWRDGMSLDTSTIERQIKEHSSIARATSLSKLWKFIRGKTEIGYLDAARLALRRLHHAFEQWSTTSARINAREPNSNPSHPEVEDLSSDLMQILASGRNLAMFLAEGEPGKTIMSFHAHQAMSKMQRAAALRISQIAGGDHTFSRRAPREELSCVIIEHLRGRYLVHDRAKSLAFR